MSAATHADLRKESAGYLRRHSAAIHDGAFGRTARGVRVAAGRGGRAGRPFSLGGGTACVRRGTLPGPWGRSADDRACGSAAVRPVRDEAGEGRADAAGADASGVAAGVTVRSGTARRGAVRAVP